MALDVGDRRIGVAVSDSTGMTAQPLVTVERDGGEMDALLSLVAETGAELMVIGLPLLMDGTEGEQAARTRRFGEQAEGALPVPVVYVDERLTSREADAAMAGARRRRKGPRGARDRVAAALILRTYLASGKD